MLSLFRSQILYFGGLPVVAHSHTQILLIFREKSTALGNPKISNELIGC
jgi:hypothetical protein